MRPMSLAEEQALRTEEVILRLRRARTYSCQLEGSCRANGQTSNSWRWEELRTQRLQPKTEMRRAYMSSRRTRSTAARREATMELSERQALASKLPRTTAADTKSPKVSVSNPAAGCQSSQTSEPSLMHSMTKAPPH